MNDHTKVSVIYTIGSDGTLYFDHCEHEEFAQEVLGHSPNANMHTAELSVPCYNDPEGYTEFTSEDVLEVLLVHLKG